MKVKEAVDILQRMNGEAELYMSHETHDYLHRRLALSISDIGHGLAARHKIIDDKSLRLMDDDCDIHDDEEVENIIIVA